MRVLTADNQLWMPNLPVEIDEQYATRTPWFDINKPIEFLLGGKKQIVTKGFEGAKRLPGIVKALGYFYRNYVNFPDGQIGWYPFAIKGLRHASKNC